MSCWKRSMSIYADEKIIETKESVEIINKMQPCNRIYYSKIYCFKWHTAHHRELYTVFAASGLYTHVVTSRCEGWVEKLHSITRLHLVGYFYWFILWCTDQWILNLGTEETEIQCGIFQAGWLSPPPFCNSFTPLTEQLNTGYEEHITNTKISHLLYVDDLKVQVRQRKESKNRCKQLEPSVMISIWNLDLTVAQRLYSKRGMW